MAKTKKHNFAYFIACYGKPNKILTYDALKKLNAEYPIYLVVGDDDPKCNEYLTKYGEIVLIYNKTKYLDVIDKVGFYQQSNIICTYSRLATTDFAKILGIEYVAHLVDDITGFVLKYTNSNNKVAGITKFNVDQIIDLYIDFLASSDNIFITGAPQSSFYIGIIPDLASTTRISRRPCNMVIYSTNDTTLKYPAASVVEDMDFIIRNNSIGQLSVCPSGLQVVCSPPKTETTCYGKMSESEYYQQCSLIFNTTINVTKPRFSYKKFEPCIISEKFRKE